MFDRLHFISLTTLSFVFVDRDKVRTVQGIAIALPLASLVTTKLNRSPKGNMWSAIPVALLYIIVN